MTDFWSKVAHYAHRGGAPDDILRELDQRARPPVLIFRRIAHGMGSVGPASAPLLFAYRRDIPLRLIAEAVAAPNRPIDAGALVKDDVAQERRVERAKQRLTYLCTKLEARAPAVADALRRRLRVSQDATGNISLFYQADGRAPIITTGE